MYYVKEEDIGIEGVKYLGNEGCVKEMLELYHYHKVLNIKVVKGVEPDSTTQSHENYMNTQQSCSVRKELDESKLQNIRNDRNTQLERSRIQREQYLNHFKGDTEVSEFCSDVSVHLDRSVEVVVIESESESKDERPLELIPDTILVKHVKNPGPTSRSHQELEKKQIPNWFPEAKMFKGFSYKDFEVFLVPHELPYKNYCLVFTEKGWV
ncbi:hypothetical protein D1007_25039 [Hordeum vulgare]|nr:hypothetical protein D1007_25039 [Hordeum vulgare]